MLPILPFPGAIVLDMKCRKNEKQRLVVRDLDRLDEKDWAKEEKR